MGQTIFVDVNLYTAGANLIAGHRGDVDDINTRLGLDGRIDQPLHLLRVGDIHRDGMKVDPFQPFRAT